MGPRPRPGEAHPPTTSAREATFLQRDHGYRFFHYEGIYATSLFAHFVVRMQTITGARIGEVQQIAQSPHCITQLMNVGPKSAMRWVLRMAPKGHKERADYFIDEDTKDVLVEVVRFLRARLGIRKLPIVSHESPKYAADRYVLQWNGRALGRARISIRPCGSCSMTSRWRRVERASISRRTCSDMGLPRKWRASMCRPRSSRGSCISDMSRSRRYYARPTKQQVVEAAELLFVDRIDVAAEAVRHPDEIGQLLRDAEGQIGALSEVLGGTCVVGNMCPAKFACVGCAGNAPDPNRRASNRHEAALGRTTDSVDDQGGTVRGATADDPAGARL